MVWFSSGRLSLHHTVRKVWSDFMRPVRTQIGRISDQHEVFTWDWCELCSCSSRPWYVSVSLLFASLEWWAPFFRMLNEKTSDKQQQLLPPNSCTSKGQANDRKLLSATLNNDLSISSKWMKALECRLGRMLVSDQAKARVSEPFPTPSRSRSLSFGIGFTLLRWLSYLRFLKRDPPYAFQVEVSWGNWVAYFWYYK